MTGREHDRDGHGQHLRRNRARQCDPGVRNRVTSLIYSVMANVPGVPGSPEPTDCVLRGFGDSGPDVAVRFRGEGIDGRENSYASDVLFAVWNGIEIPYPHRIAEIKGPMPQ